MGRERQKKKNKSSVNKAKLKSNGRTKTGKRKVNFLGSAIIADNWDRKLTLTQNYKLLGLSSRLNAPTGGREKTLHHDEQVEARITGSDPFSMPKSRKTTKLVPGETKVERDPETGRIIRIIREGVDDEDTTATKRRRLNPLNDPLEELSEESKITRLNKQRSTVVSELEAQAEEEAEAFARKKRPRQQSKREEEWIEKLVQRHGDDTRSMVRDMKLNPMQQSEGDIQRRLKIWKENTTWD